MGGKVENVFRRPNCNCMDGKPIAAVYLIHATLKSFRGKSMGVGRGELKKDEKFLKGGGGWGGCAFTAMLEFYLQSKQREESRCGFEESAADIDARMKAKNSQLQSNRKNRE